MADNAPPSQDPADDDSLVGVFNSVLAKFLQSLDDMLPAVVVAYDRTKNRATVRPLVMVGTTDGQKVSRAEIPSVPVLNLGAGGFVMSFPVKAGDLGWVKASDRDISLFLQTVAEEWPNTKRMHKFADGLFIPDALRGFTVNAEDADRLVIQTTDGATRVAIGPGLVRVVAAQVQVQAQTVTVNATTSVAITSPTVTMSGDLTVVGTITGDTDVKSGTIRLRTHKHLGVTTGGGTSGGPTP